MKLDDLPAKYQDQARPQLAVVGGQLVLPGKPGVLVASDAVEEESALHEDIRKLCQLRGWLPLHGSMAHKSHRTEGEADFCCLLPGALVVFVECKTKEGKLSKAQQELAAWMHYHTELRASQEW